MQEVGRLGCRCWTRLFYHSDLERLRSFFIPVCTCSVRARQVVHKSKTRARIVDCGRMGAAGRTATSQPGPPPPTHYSMEYYVLPPNLTSFSHALRSCCSTPRRAPPCPACARQCTHEKGWSEPCATDPNQRDSCLELTRYKACSAIWPTPPTSSGRLWVQPPVPASS